MSVHGAPKDDVLARITNFACGLEFAHLETHDIEKTKERLVDSVGCAIGAQACEAAEIGRSVATLALSGGLSGRVVGTAEVYSAESSTFINGCLIRDLDYSDTYPGGHPSDTLAGLLSVAPVVGASGEDLIKATVVAYDVFIRLQDSAELNTKGWDQGFAISVGAAAGLASLMRLDRDTARNAISITAVANLPMRASRAGQLSNWKGAACAYHVRNATFGVELAKRGMTGPEAPFTGRDGLEEQVTKTPLVLDPFLTEGGVSKVSRTKIKHWPVAYQLQALVWAGIKLKEELAGQTPVDIEIRTFFFSWRESGSEPAKWDPRTRETADHSAPYILAWVLRHGGIDHRAFEPEAFLDPSFRPVMNTIRVVVDEEITKQHPKMFRMRVLATTADGSKHEAEIINPLGHDDNPMSREQFNDKFDRLTGAWLGKARVKAALDTWWNIEKGDVAAAMDSIVVEGKLGNSMPRRQLQGG